MQILFLLALSWFRTNVPQFSVPTAIIQTTCCLLTPPLPFHSLSQCQTGEENWRHKRWRLWVEITIYWEQQWNKRHNSTDINKRLQEKQTIYMWKKVLHTENQLYSNHCHAALERWYRISTLLATPEIFLVRARARTNTTATKWSEVFSPHGRRIPCSSSRVTYVN